ncbi:alcohol dehydrogenase catalytic domain-containing protein [Clostridium sp. CF011]|uniref:alcohol dehydrogenase catalytic domain-containing protein n=1 Tax=Clostridium sp. CF011 TaxID=2843318 RepID=UPI001C0CA11F|nr:alcohol dehydrogenase catalytic domain-containing protein [Clostridium sp. CF011]MBU3093179.1 alcohol dehydrogenase catalytic domain-containing protein [Clostridium sp. CF011]WAG69316.1 alcohol dehydrogenase catalytic domain-containing protein [Clostridium sp. CF011]
MLTRGFKIVQSKRFEIYIEDLEVCTGHVVVKIETAAICKADLRYYLGSRDERTLNLKYPINLIHEAIGTVVKDPTNSFNKGDKVALVPNIMIPKDEQDVFDIALSSDKRLGENYCPKALFASSSYNGFSKDYIAYPAYNLVKIEDNIDSNIAVFSELISVANTAIRRIVLKPDDVIGIWGDGILGYIICSVLKQIHNGPIIVIGHNKEKLEKFVGVQTYLSNDSDIKKSKINVAFECIGGAASESGIDEIINSILPGSKMVLTGVSENPVKINTRKVLEKGLAFYGITRSNVEDFKFAAELLKKPDFRSDISKLILEVAPIYGIKDYYRVFEVESENRALGKYIMNFKF